MRSESTLFAIDLIASDACIGMVPFIASSMSLSLRKNGASHHWSRRTLILVGTTPASSGGTYDGVTACAVIADGMGTSIDEPFSPAIVSNPRLTYRGMIAIWRRARRPCARSLGMTSVRVFVFAIVRTPKETHSALTG